MHEQDCLAIIATLPEWFGYESAFSDVSHAVKKQPGFVAIEKDEVVGFVAVLPVFDETLEITHLAVRRRERRRGTGRALLLAVRDYAKSSGAASICLLTLGPSAESVSYGETVAFYRAIGFWRTKEAKLTDWGGAPALVMSAPVSNIDVD
jgi:ribosomal protein S18 acetylase RimI-like enzyme